jgi:PhnB protein
VRSHHAIVLLLFCVLVEQQAIRLAATSNIDADARVAVWRVTPEGDTATTLASRRSGVAVYPRGKDMNKFKPDSWPTVTPRIFTDDVARLAGFLKVVFGASGTLRSGAPTELRIGDSVVLISDGGGVREAMPAFLYVYVENADEAYQRAIAAGAESIERPGDMPYGDRRATVRDSWGNIWQIATYRGR